MQTLPFGKLCWQTNMPYWQPSSSPLEDSISSDCTSAFHQLRNTSREGCLRSWRELMECYVKWMTYSSSERRKISTMNASVKCLEDSRKRTSHWTRINVSSRFKKSNYWARPSMSRESTQIKTRSKQLSACRNQQMSVVSVDFSEWSTSWGSSHPHLAEITKPTRDLLSKKNDWTW